jgi:hypothetical protein
MVELCITKYNPKYRDSSGAYKKNEWVSVSDIGKVFEDGILTTESYLAVEDAYVDAALLFLEQFRIKSLTIKYLEERSPADCPPGKGDENRLWLKDLELGKAYFGSELARLIRLNLREVCWTKLEGAQNTYLHFGYDYYMYIGTDSTVTRVDDIHFPDLLFVEQVESPYHQMDEETDDD